jgi:hypothetical protein
MVHGRDTEVDMMGMLRAGLFLLLLAALAFPACIDNATDIVLSEQGTNLIAVFMLTVLLIAIAYIVGNFLRNPSYIIFAKDEAYHLGFSIALLAAFSSIVLFTCSTMDLFYVAAFEHFGTNSTCYSAGAGTTEVSSCYINMVNNDARWMAESYIKSYIKELMDSTFSYTIQIPLTNAYTLTAGAYKRIISNQYDMILNTFIVPALMSLSMQKLALDFINENAIRWILPSAFVLRAFMPTRQIGNMLIALSLGVYVIVPFMFVFNLTMYEVVFDDCTAYAEAVCDNAIDSNACSSAPATTCENPDSFWNVARLIPQAFFLPNLTVAILITFLASMNKALRVIG